jgi:6-phosphogluconolactonase
MELLPRIHNILQEHQILSHLNQGITVASVSDAGKGITLAKDILKEIVDQKTVLYLSGGSTPKGLYEQLAKEKHIKPGAIGIIDERYGEPMHDKSNEKMIRETGLLTYATARAIPFYPILSVISSVSEKSPGISPRFTRRDDNSREETAEAYDETLRQLTATFQKSVGILGIGNDGHTSGIAPNRSDFHNPLFEKERAHLLFSEFSDPKSFYGERVAMTSLGLSMLDVLIVLVFGSAKQHALQQLFEEGSEEEIPSRFFKRPDIAKKTLLITNLLA